MGRIITLPKPRPGEATRKGARGYTQGSTVVRREGGGGETAEGILYTQGQKG